MNPHIIQLKDVEYEYPDGTKALKGISLKIERGKKTAILGPNGAGKSTFLLHLNGILKPKKGQIIFDGREIRYSRSELKNLRKQVGIVFQDPDTQIFAGTVFQEVSFGPMNLGLDGEEVKSRVEKALKDAGIDELSQKPTHLLSYGQKKRVSIAAVLAMEPEVIIFDEPTAYLDPKHSRKFVGILDSLHEQGKHIILSTHDVDLAYSWADHVFILKDGRLLKAGGADEIFRDEELLREADLSKPLLLEVFNILRKKYTSLPQPRNIDELKNYLLKVEG